MKVFKFGGASLESIERIRNVGEILRSFPGDPLLVVISAMGKTTNELEKVAEHYYRRKREIAAQLLFNIEQKHSDLAGELLQTREHPVFDQLRQFFTEMEWQLGEKPYNGYDYYYDQIVSMGELLSSAIVSAYLNEAGISNLWMDVRDIIRTDETYRDGTVDWTLSQEQANRNLRPLFDQHPVVITQGFIGSTPRNTTTTLGREGSDYTAAIFTSLLDAESLTIWKDVEGLKNADPKIFPDTVNITEINYNEVIEMAYYGAQVIHPKTIKPLQNKGIPLYVKCFLDPVLPGTVIREGAEVKQLPSIIVLKKNQVLITVSARDFSFITEENISRLYNTFHGLKIKINLMQNGAISFSCCIDHDTEKIERLIKTLHRDFSLTYHEGLQMLTVRHYKPELVQELTKGKRIMLEQKSPLTVQLVMKG